MWDEPIIMSAAPIIERTLLTARHWKCDACAGQLVRGDAIRVIITPGGGRNVVEHDPSCRVAGGSIS